MPGVYIGIGSNVDPQRHVIEALDTLNEFFGPLETSSIYQTSAVGFEGNDFLNLVAGFDTGLSPHELVASLRHIEAEHGRSRGDERYAPRTLDLDLLLYGDLVLDDGEIRLPRNEIERHAFVLAPLAELAGERRHPVLGRSFAELWTDMEGTQEPIRRLEAELWPSPSRQTRESK